MKFGIFYEHQIPRPWDADSEHRIYREALEKVELADRLGIVRQREEQEQHGHVKRVAFVLALRSLTRRYFRLRMKLHMDQAEALEHVTPFLFVGNNRYQTAGLEIGTRSRLDSGQLWVCTAPRTNRQNFVHLALKTLVGRDTDQDLSAFESKEIWVQPGTPRVNVSTDGEVCVIDAPLHYTIRPKALRVVVPARKTRSES